MQFQRHNSKCSICPLRDQTRVWSKGAFNYPIAFIGEAPGRDEEIDKEPFVGAAGKLFMWGLGAAGMLKHQVWCMNTTCCRPPDNNLSSLEGSHAKTNCHAGFKEELEFLRKQGVKVLVPLGNEALESLGIADKISRARGSVYLREGFIVVPTYHPSYINRSQHKKDSTTVTFKYVWIADMKKALGIAMKGSWKPPVENFILSPTLEVVLEWINKAIHNKSLVAVDIETTGLTPDTGTTVVIGLASSGEDAISIPILQQGGGSYWVDGDFLQIQTALNQLFAMGNLVFQNSLFDVNFLRGDGYQINFSHVVHDTLILHHAISPELPHSLDFIVSVYGDTPYWKGEAKDRKGRILDVPDTELRTYNLRDAVVLHQVLPGLLADLKEIHGEDVYYHEAIPLLAPVGEMIETGILLDTKILNNLKEGWTHERDTLEATLREMGKLPSSFSLGSGDDLRWFLYGVQPAKFEKIQDLKEFEVGGNGDKKPRRKGTKAHAELLRLQELSEQTASIYRLQGFGGRKTKEGNKVSVDKAGLLSLTIGLQNRLSMIKEYQHAKFRLEQEDLQQLLKWLSLFREFREMGKLLSTYTNYPVRSDGRVHAQFLIHGTATGRLSSRKPNLQNIPKKHLEARSAFVAPKGFIFISADYSNLEVRILAYETNDKNLIQMLEEGVNVHDENTRILFGYDPSHQNYQMARRAAKIFQFGGLSYGGSDQEIFGKILLEVPSLPLTLAAYKQAKSRWMGVHDGYREWERRIRSGVHLTRKAVTFGGRTRTLHGFEKDIEKQALNTPIQGGATHVINRSLIRLHQEKISRKLISKLVLQVHDQLVYQVPLAEKGIMETLIRSCMEAEVLYLGTPRRFPVDIEIGTNWGALQSSDNDVDVEDEGDEV